jgi:hypothetical protein
MALTLAAAALTLAALWSLYRCGWRINNAWAEAPWERQTREFAAKQRRLALERRRKAKEQHDGNQG